jgi:microcystin-dependent protein
MPGAFSYGMTPTNSPKGSAFQAVQPSVIPVGVIEMFAGSTAPNGWLVCDGSTVSRSVYSDLFKIIGTTYGAGNSNTTFTLPDMRGRTPIGVGTGSGLTARTIGTTYGTQTFTLAAENIPSLTVGNMSANSTHTHTSSLAALWAVPSGGGANLNAGTTFQTYNTNQQMQVADIQHQHTYTNASLTPVTFLPPALAVNYIIKT